MGKKKWLQLPDFHTYVIFSTLPRILEDDEQFVLHKLVHSQNLAKDSNEGMVATFAPSSYG
jgi:hypothetical protein